MFTDEDDMEGTGPVRDGQAIDADRVAGWLGDRVAVARPLAISQFKGGQSNPTYLVTDAAGAQYVLRRKPRSEEHTSELQSLMRISYAVFCLKKKTTTTKQTTQRTNNIPSSPNQHKTKH